MQDLAIIGGTGLTSLPGLSIIRREVVTTPYGSPSGPLTYGEYCSKKILFIPRHGTRHTIPPHMVNYRANIWALYDREVKNIVAVAAVGGIHQEIIPTRLVIPAQIIDYTWGRSHTFFEKDLRAVTHVDFASPYCEELRRILLQAATNAGLNVFQGGTYAATQGPRLETAAEIDRLERDDCDVVGMTGMPEAGLAKELDLCYAHCNVCVNWAAGRGEGPITLDGIEASTRQGMVNVRKLLAKLMDLI